MTQKEEAPLDLVIVRSLIIDMYGRYGMEQQLKSTSPGVLATMFEDWQERVSIELHHKGVINEVYKAENYNKLGDYDAQVLLNEKFLCDYDDYR
ncbi:hypothetical protein [Priestia megaterium]|uniref:Uncharacterized protein n=1 Tax=Priestia megaterium TaxID=1404 RepID=A0A6M6E754_PRIMG|nr:hypothetical protein [Priestia megaterium]QJX80378.1 hypothetical protein FDZ14_30290 [Priestia megaterium]